MLQRSVAVHTNLPLSRAERKNARGHFALAEIAKWNSELRHRLLPVVHNVRELRLLRRAIGAGDELDVVQK